MIDPYIAMRDAQIELNRQQLREKQTAEAFQIMGAAIIAATQAYNAQIIAAVFKSPPISGGSPP